MKRRKRLTMVHFEKSLEGYSVRITYPDRKVKEQQLNVTQARELYNLYKTQGAIIVGHRPLTH